MATTQTAHEPEEPRSFSQEAAEQCLTVLWTLSRLQRERAKIGDVSIFGEGGDAEDSPPAA